VQGLRKMSRIYEFLKRVEREARPEPAPRVRSARVVSVVNNKGGIGKSTIACNLAVHLRAMHEDLPILVLSLDDQSLVDRMFALPGTPPAETLGNALRRKTLERAICMGQYGIHYVATCQRIGELKRSLDDASILERAIAGTRWNGLVVVDTKSDLDILTQAAIVASDLVLVLVSDQASLLQADRVFELLDERGVPRERVRVVLSLIDLRVKFREGDRRDLLGFLIEEIRRRGYPLLQSFVSRSPKVESLYSNPEGRAIPVLHGARGTPASQQFHHLASEVWAALPDASSAPATAPRARLRGLTPTASAVLRGGPLDLWKLPFRIGRGGEDADDENELVLRDEEPFQVSRRHAAIVLRDGALGVIDRGSRLGCIVDGRRIGGRSDERGPVYFAGDRGVLVLGQSDSPYVFEVMIEGAEARKAG
jgi:cellulose biosynthesis protein BcsQ